MLETEYGLNETSNYDGKRIGCFFLEQPIPFFDVIAQ